MQLRTLFSFWTAGGRRLPRPYTTPPTRGAWSANPRFFAISDTGSEGASDETLAAGYYRALYRDLEPYADLEALLSAMRVFAPYL